eukprot:10770-Heterococcus_DN1.PRE.5
MMRCCCSEYAWLYSSSYSSSGIMLSGLYVSRNLAAVELQRTLSVSTKLLQCVQAISAYRSCMMENAVQQR